jgi:zinc protease
MKHSFLSRLFLACMVFMSITDIIYAQNTTLPIDKRVKIGKLPNGMTYYICKNNKPKNRVELRLAVNSGAVQEDANQDGMAHLVEHMCFNGTSHFPKNDLIHYLQSVGVGFGDGINGYTSFDETVYMLTVPSDSAKILDNGLLIMEDWANAVTFDTTEISKERGIVLEEWRLGLGAGRRMQNKYIPVLLKGSKYAEHLVIGTQESILHTSDENLMRFYRDWYRPDLMAIIVVGDMDPDKMEQQIIKNFGKIKSQTKPRQKETYKIDDNTEPLVCSVSDKENGYTQMMLAYKSSPVIVKTMDDYKKMIVRNIFSGMLNQRLNDLTKNSDPPFVYANAYYGNLWVRSCDGFQVQCVVKEDGADKGMKALLTETERVKRYGYIQPELDRFKKSYLKSLETEYNERDKQESGNLVWTCVSNFLQNEPMPGIEFTYDFVKKNLGTISLADVNKLASQLITDKNEVAIVMGVEKQGVKLMTDQEINDNYKWIKTAKIDPYKESAIATNLIANKPKPGKIAMEKQISNTGITELTLSNGMKVVLKPTDFKNDEIRLESFSWGGFSLFGSEYKLSAQLAAEIVLQSGLDKFPKQELDKMMAGKNVNVSPYIYDIRSGFDASSSISDMETMFQQIYLYFTAPRRDESAYNSTVAKYNAIYKNALSNPVNYFFNEVESKLYNGNPDAPNVLPSEKDWEQMSLDKVMEVYKRNFSNAGNFTLIFAGSFKLEQIKPLIETYLASLPSTGKTETFVDKGLRPIAGPANEIINKGTDPKTFVYLAINGPAKWSIKESHALWSLSNILQRVYVDKLREEMSGVYGFGIEGNVECQPYENFHFAMTIPCAPENADKLVNAVIAEIERMKTQGPTKEEIEKELESQRRSVETNVRENWWWLMSIHRIYRFEKDFGRIEKPYSLNEMITPQLIKETAQKYLDTKKIVRYTLYPENYKKAGDSK